MITYAFAHDSTIMSVILSDATEEYIRGSTINSSSSQEARIPTSGLGCVTVLIGGYDIESGKPIIGVINQPFAELTDTGLSNFLHSNLPYVS